MNATAKNGDVWTGEREGELWIYSDKGGNLYSSRETPAYRVVMDNAVMIEVNGKRTISPLRP